MIGKLCPCCGRRCYMDELKCERGREYAKTGVIPPRRPKPGHGPQGGPEGRPNPHRRYMKLTTDEKLAVTVSDIAAMLQQLPKETEAKDVFDCLRIDDKQQVLMFMEKIKGSLRHRVIGKQ